MTKNIIVDALIKDIEKTAMIRLTGLQPKARSATSLGSEALRKLEAFFAPISENDALNSIAGRIFGIRPPRYTAEDFFRFGRKEFPISENWTFSAPNKR